MTSNKICANGFLTIKGAEANLYTYLFNQLCFKYTNLHPHPLWYNAPNLTLSIRDSDELNHTQNIPVQFNINHLINHQICCKTDLGPSFERSRTPGTDQLEWCLMTHPFALRLLEQIEIALRNQMRKSRS